MTLANEFVRAIDRLFSTMGVSATYTDRAGAETSCTVIVDYDLSQYGDAFEVSKSVATVAVRKSEVTFSPRQGDTFLVGSTTFVVDTTTQSDELEHVSLVS